MFFIILYITLTASSLKSEGYKGMVEVKECTCPFQTWRPWLLPFFLIAYGMVSLRAPKKRHSPNLFKPQDFPSVPILVEYACTGNNNNNNNNNNKKKKKKHARNMLKSLYQMGRKNMRLCIWLSILVNKTRIRYFKNYPKNKISICTFNVS